MELLTTAGIVDVSELLPTAPPPPHAAKDDNSMELLTPAGVADVPELLPPPPPHAVKDDNTNAVSRYLLLIDLIFAPCV